MDSSQAVATVDSDVKQTRARLPWLGELPQRAWPVLVHPSVLEAAKPHWKSLPPQASPHVERLVLESLNVEVIVIGTDHMRPSVAAAAESLVREAKPHAVMVELCVDRIGNLLAALEAKAGATGELATDGGSHAAGNVAFPHVMAAAADPQDFMARLLAPSSSAAVIHPWLTLPHQFAGASRFGPPFVHDALNSGVTGAVTIAVNDQLTLLGAELLHYDLNQLGGDMARSAEAALDTGAMLFLGDRSIAVSDQREVREEAAKRSSMLADALESSQATLAALAGSWAGLVRALGASIERERAWRFEAGSEDARIAAAEPALDALEHVMYAAAGNLLVHGEALATADDCNASVGSAPADRAAAALANGGRKALMDVAEIVVGMTCKLPDKPVCSYFLTQEAAEQRKLADALLLPDGQVRRDKASALGTAELVWARRAAAGVVPGGGWGPQTSAAVQQERDAILASSILHMRDAMERAAASEAKARSELAHLLATAQSEAAATIDRLKADMATAAHHAEHARVREATALLHAEGPHAQSPPEATAAAQEDRFTETDRSAINGHKAAEAFHRQQVDEFLADAEAQLRNAAAEAAEARAALSVVSAASDSIVPLGRRAAELVDDWQSPSPLADKRLRLVAVVGLRHVSGILRYLRAADTLAAQAAAHLDKNMQHHQRSASGTADAGARPAASDSVSSGNDAAATHAELVRQGFLPTQPFMPLHEMLPGQLGALAEAGKPPLPAAAAAEAACTSSVPNTDLGISRRALLRAVAACSVDEQISPTLSADPGLAFKLKHTVAPLAVGAACVVLPFVRKAPRPLRIAAGALTLTAVAGAGAMLAAALKVFVRLDMALDAADRRCGSKS